jgi:glutamate-1-semialdehyde 2,1-aminomutase
VYTDLDQKGEYLKTELKPILDKKGVPYVINQLGSMISIHFSEKPVIDFESAAAARNDIFNKLFHHMLDNGIYLPSSAFETWFISHTIGSQEIDRTLEAVDSFLK